MAFEGLTEARRKKNPSNQYSRVYNSDFGVFIDTTNIIRCEKDGYLSFTFKIENNDVIEKIENLVLNINPNRTYSAYITKYDLSEIIANDENLNDIKPSSITNLFSTESFSIGGDRAECLTISTTTVSLCRNASGNTIINNGDLRNGCVGMGWTEERTTYIIDMSCMGNSPGGGPDSADLQSEPLTIFSPKIMKYIESLFLILTKQNYVGYLY